MQFDGLHSFDSYLFNFSSNFTKCSQSKAKSLVFPTADELFLYIN